VHAAQRAFFVVKGDVRLRNDGLEAVRLEFLLAEDPGKEASLIFFTL
jgi:hypothetical protein